MGKINCLAVSVFVVFILALSGMLYGQRVIDLDKVWGDMRVLGDDANDNSGRAVAYGDINGDGYMDVIIGYEAVDSGEIYVIFGHSSPPSTIDLSTQSADITICGADAYGRFGWAVASGDFNDDGFADIIIGAPYADTGTPSRIDAGKAYVIFGASFSSPPYTIYLVKQPADITVIGAAAGDNFGYTLASGNVNGDGYDDIIVSAPYADPPSGSGAGETYVILGSSSPPSTIDLSTEKADITICGPSEKVHCGYAVASGNINGDGCDDIIIGAPHYAIYYPFWKASPGVTYVIFGSSSPPSTIDLSTESADITVKGAAADDYSGWSVASGNINGDGFDDIIIAAPNYGAGETYVIFGSSSPPSTINLSTESADITVYGADAGDCLGSAVASGDVNSDGFMDIIIGARYADPAGGSDAGETYVIFGGSYPSPAYTIDLDSQPADITICGDNGSDCLGSALASGDVNGDGYHDLIIGVNEADPGGRSAAGETYLILGGGTIITAHGLGGSGWIKEFSLLGRGWSTFKAFGPVNSQGEVPVAVGDIDGDGHDEIAAGHGEGGSSWVKLFEVDGSLIKPFKAFGAVNSQGEVHLAVGNFDTNPNDKEIAVAQGEGGQSWVKLFRANGTLILIFKAFGPENAQGEVHLAAADLENNDGIDEIIAGMGEGGSSWVKIFNRNGALIRKFRAFGPSGNPGGEVHLAVGNFDADADLEIAVATGYTGGNKVKLFENDGTFIRQFAAFGAGGNPNGEVQITSADIDNNGVWELICAHGEGGSSWVKVFKADGTCIRGFKAFGAVNSQGEVHLAKSNY